MILYANQYELLKRFGNTTISNKTIARLGEDAIKQDIFVLTGLKVKLIRFQESNSVKSGAYFRQRKTGYHYIIEVIK